MEQDLVIALQEIIATFGPRLWLATVTIIVTGFVMLWLKNLIADLVYYIRARMSDIGFSQRIYYNGEIFLVRSIHFKYIVIYDDKKIIRIPIKKYMDGPIAFPQPRYDDFDEQKYHQKKWDGKTERRTRPGPPEPKPPVPDPPGGKTPPSGESPSSEDIAHKVVKTLTDRMIFFLLGEERYDEIFLRSSADFDEDEDEIISKLTEEDFNNINTGLAALVRMDRADIFDKVNRAGEALTKEDIEKARRMRGLVDED